MTETPKREYVNINGNVVSLDWLVRNEPEWAANQIRHRDTIERESNLLNSVNRELNREVMHLTIERDQLKRGEFICSKCGLRKDSEQTKGDF